MASEEIKRRNFLLNLIEGALFSSTTGLISAQTVIPALISKLGGENVAVGAVGVITYTGLFLPQIFAARYVETHAWKKPWALKYGLIQRIVLLTFALTLMVFGKDHPQIALYVVLIMFTLNQIMLGVTTPGWFEMFAKMIPVRRRGRLAGIRSSIGGVGAFLCGIVLTWIFARFEFPMNYSLAVLGAFVIQASSLVVQTYLVEESPSPVLQRKPFFAYLQQLPDVLKTNIPFRNFIVATVVLIIATVPVSFYTVYALKRFSANETAVGAFTLAIVAVQVVSSLGIGFVADRRGNKFVLIIAAVALFLANLWAMFAPSLEWFMLVFIFLGINLGIELLARYNIAIEYGPAEQRAMYVGLMNTVVAPFYLVAMIGGAIIDAFGYATVFWIGTLASVVGIALMVRYVPEPRTLTSPAAA